MKILLIVLIFLLNSIETKSQIDTFVLKNKVEQLINQDSIQMFLDFILKEDQHYRGELTNISMDLEHLFTLSYFLNKFGSPTEENFGKSVMVLRSVWIHIPFLALRRLSFPLIHSAYLSGNISENDLRNYYLRKLYEDRFDDDKYLTLPIDSLFSLLNLNSTSSIPIRTLFLETEKIKSLRNIPKKELWKWNGPIKTKIVTVNGERKEMAYSDSPVEIFVLKNCNIYFQKVHSDNSYEPKELIKIGERKFKFKNQITNKYFEIKDNGNLLYKDDSTVFQEYIQSK